MTESASTSEASITDDAGRLAVDLACLRCGYNLRGLAMGARCPECGTPVGRSIHGNLLRYCDPSWLRWIAYGTIALIVATLLGSAVEVAVVLMLMPSYAWMIPAWEGLQPMADWLNDFGRSGWLCAIVVPAALIAAMWMLTKPERGRLEPEHLMSARRICRWCAVAASLGLILLFWATWRQTVGQSMYWFVWLACCVAGLAATAMGVRCLRQLALRVPDKKLAFHCRALLWGGLLAVLPLMLHDNWLWMMLPQWRSSGSWYFYLVYALSALPIAGLIALVFLSLLLVWIGFRLLLHVDAALRHTRTVWEDDVGQART